MRFRISVAPQWACAAFAVFAAPAAGAEEASRWARPWDIPAESDFFRDRLEQPWNHFLLDGQQGFLSGREFYQSMGEVSPFLWPTQPFLRYAPDRAWLSDSAALAVRFMTGNEVGDALLQELTESSSEAEDNHTPLLAGDMSWSPLSDLRLHAGMDQNDHFSYRTFPFREALAEQSGNPQLAWFGDNLPPKSQVFLGGAYSRRGGTLAAQVDQGWWWTGSPVSGFVYPWEGFNVDFLYRTGEGFELSLAEQRWDSPLSQGFYQAHWRRSELHLGFLGSSRGDWAWRLDVGYQRREMVSDSLFKPFLEQGYPTRFRYRQVWNAPDSLPLQMVSQGSVGFRERMIQAQHAGELREKWGPHQFRQILKLYYRQRMSGYRVPTEAFAMDSAWTAELRPGRHARGGSGELEYREKRKAFEVGASGTYAMEWDAPLFTLEGLDTLSGATIRRGSYDGSSHMLQNAAARIFAGGNLPGRGFWKAQGGWRDFWGADADSMEFRPSRVWAGGGGGFAFPSDLRLEVSAYYMGDKEVRGWGPVFKVPAHFENNFTLAQALAQDRMKLSFSALHAFGEDIREQPNGNPLRFRILIGIAGTID